MQKRNLVAKAAAALIVGSLALTGCTTTPDKPDNAATNASKRQAIDASVDATLSRLYSTVKGSRELVAKSRGVLVFPDVIQAGFIVGGQTGNGALRRRRDGRLLQHVVAVGRPAGRRAIEVRRVPVHDATGARRIPRLDGWAGAGASVALVKMGANGAIDTTTATAPVQVVVLTNAGLMGDVSINGTKVTKLKI
jgi:lipid-binding SYLF domain-containing protein